MSIYKYTFVVQCKEFLNHAEEKIVATCRIENDKGKFMDLLNSFKNNPEIMKFIDIDDIDLELAPYKGK